MRIDLSCSASKWPRNMVADDFHFRETDALACTFAPVALRHSNVPSGNLVHAIIYINNIINFIHKYNLLED